MSIDNHQLSTSDITSEKVYVFIYTLDIIHRFRYSREKTQVLEKKKKKKRRITQTEQTNMISHLSMHFPLLKLSALKKTTNGHNTLSNSIEQTAT